MKIVYFYNEDGEVVHVKNALGEQEVVFLKGTPADHPELRDDTVEVMCVFVNARVGKSVMDRFPKLRHIATRSTGFDHIDLAEAKARGITISSVPAYGQNTVAEFAFGLLLMLSRKLLECAACVRDEGLFSQTEKLRGFDLYGKTIGIVGTGRIGEYMIRQAKGFGMKVVAFDAFPKEALANELGFAYLSFEDLLAQSDVVSFHLPYMKETHHILNRGNIGKMKKGSIVVNTARGGLIETAALAQGLREDILAGVGLDVLEDELYVEDEGQLIFNENPKIEDLKITLENHFIIDHPHAIVTPHNAFNTTEAIERILDTTVENIKAFGRGETMNLVSMK